MPCGWERPDCWNCSRSGSSSSLLTEWCLVRICWGSWKHWLICFIWFIWQRVLIIRIVFMKVLSTNYYIFTILILYFQASDPIAGCTVAKDILMLDALRSPPKQRHLLAKTQNQRMKVNCCSWPPPGWWESLFSPYSSVKLGILLRRQRDRRCV